MRGPRLLSAILWLSYLLITGVASAQLNLSVDKGAGASAQTGAAAGTSKPAEASAGASAGATGAGVSAAGATPAAGQEAAQPPAAPTEGAAGETTTTAEQEKPADASTYSVRLRDLEQRINELKEQVFRSKARLSLLAETILQGVVAGGQARLVHENHMGASYLLVKVVYALDGAPIFNKADEEGGLDARKEFDIYNGSIVPGEHTITANLEYRGQGFGIFSYLKGYRFKVRSSYSFSAPEGKAITLSIVSYEKGGPTAPLEDRPAIRYLERVSAASAAGAAAEAEKSAEKGGEE